MDGKLVWDIHCNKVVSEIYYPAGLKNNVPDIVWCMGASMSLKRIFTVARWAELLWENEWTPKRAKVCVCVCVQHTGNI